MQCMGVDAKILKENLRMDQFFLDCGFVYFGFLLHRVWLYYDIYIYIYIFIFQYTHIYI